MRIVQIFMQLQEFLWADFIFRHINSSKTYSGGFLSTWRPNRKSFENQAHFVSLSETSVHYLLCAYGTPVTSNLPNFRTEPSNPFDVTAVDFAGPLRYKIDNKEDGKCYIIIFTCASSRVFHLELTRTQEVEEFQRKMNVFIAQRGRPRLLISDNAGTFKTTAKWIKDIRKNEKLQDYLTAHKIQRRFNLAKSLWWGGIYERLIRDFKKALYKSLGRCHLLFDNLEMVIMDIEINMNNRPLTYVESECGEEQVLRSNTLIRGTNIYLINDDKSDRRRANQNAETCGQGKE